MHGLGFLLNGWVIWAIDCMYTKEGPIGSYIYQFKWKGKMEVWRSVRASENKIIKIIYGGLTMWRKWQEEGCRLRCVENIWREKQRIKWVLVLRRITCARRVGDSPIKKHEQTNNDRGFFWNLILRIMNGSEGMVQLLGKYLKTTLV